MLCETYVIPGEPHSRIIALNGPAARKGDGDQVFILSYALIDPAKEEVTPSLVEIAKKGIIEMILCLNVGNSHLYGGVFQKENLISFVFVIQAQPLAIQTNEAFF